MEDLYATYKDKIEFIIVYIREAHPEMLRSGNKTGVVGRPKDIDERVILASECVTRYKFTMPMVIDQMDGKVNKDYQAGPVRVTITDKNGKVAYYAGRGPFDFRLSKVDKVLKKLVANNGFMPPAPDPKWGMKNKGLQCGLSIDPCMLVQGCDVTLIFKFKNLTDKRMEFYFDSAHALDNLVVKNKKGDILSIKPAVDDNPLSRMMRNRRFSRIRPIRIDPGQIYKYEIDCTVASAASIGGFDAVFNYEASKEKLPEGFWTGKLSSGVFKVDLAPPPQKTCFDCHGKKNYHHESGNDCKTCHVGEAETDSFGMNPNGCTKCHQRKDAKGRRSIIKPDGEFFSASVHLPGKLVEKDCLLCHDHSSHQQGVVTLTDPHSNGKKRWAGSMTDFCLTCHNNKPPKHIIFPRPKGTGYDKSNFISSNASGNGNGSCLDCHATHGSAFKPLLKKEGIKSPH